MCIYINVETVLSIMSLKYTPMIHHREKFSRNSFSKRETIVTLYGKNEVFSIQLWYQSFDDYFSIQNCVLLIFLSEHQNMRLRLGQLMLFNRHFLPDIFVMIAEVSLIHGNIHSSRSIPQTLRIFHLQKI